MYALNELKIKKYIINNNYFDQELKKINYEF